MNTHKQSVQFKAEDLTPEQVDFILDVAERMPFGEELKGRLHSISFWHWHSFSEIIIYVENDRRIILQADWGDNGAFKHTEVILDDEYKTGVAECEREYDRATTTDDLYKEFATVFNQRIDMY